MSQVLLKQMHYFLIVLYQMIPNHYYSFKKKTCIDEAIFQMHYRFSLLIMHVVTTTFVSSNV